MRCLFCHQPVTHQRLADGQMVDLCADHYQSKTLGEIVEQIRKVGLPKKEVIVEKEIKEEKKEPESKVISKLKADGYPFNKLKRKK